MKKLILTTVIAGLTVSSAAFSAATIYKKDDLKLKLGGDYQVQVYQPVGTDEELGMDYDDLELNFGAIYKLDHGFSAFGQLDSDWKNQGDGSDDDVVDQAYVGLEKSGFTASLGHQNWGSDDFGVEKAIEMDGGTAFPETSGSDTIKFSYGISRFNATLSHDLEEDSDESATDLLLTTKFGKAKVGLVYQEYKKNATSDAVKTVGAMASLVLGKANVGIDYSTNDEADFVNLAVELPLMDKVVSAAGATIESPSDEDDSIVHWYANASYHFNSKVKVFAEVGGNDTDDAELGYLAGMRVKF